MGQMSTRRDAPLGGKAALNACLRYAGPDRLHPARLGVSVGAWPYPANVVVGIMP